MYYYSNTDGYKKRDVELDRNDASAHKNIARFFHEYYSSAGVRFISFLYGKRASITYN